MTSVKEFKINYNNNDLTYRFNSQSNSINKITIIFNNNPYTENRNLTPGEIILIFKNQDNMLNLINLFFKEINQQMRLLSNIKIILEIDNQNKDIEKDKIIKNLGDLGLKYEVIYVTSKNNQQINNMNSEENQQEKHQEIEKQQQEIIAKGNERIVTQGIDGQNKNYVINRETGIVREDNGSLSELEEKERLLKEWLNDPMKKEWLESMTPEQRNKELDSIIQLSKKNHPLESPVEVNKNSNNDLSNVSTKVAEELLNAKVNPETGIIINKDKITAVEEQMNGSFQVVTPNVADQEIKSENTNINQGYEFREQNYDNIGEYNVTTTEEDVQERNVENIYYIDDSDNIYDQSGSVIGKLCVDGYYTDANNDLYKHNEKLGPVENLRDMKDNKTQKKGNTKTLKLTDQNKNGYVSFMLITVGISIMLIIYTILKLN